MSKIRIQYGALYSGNKVYRTVIKIKIKSASAQEQAGGSGGNNHLQSTRCIEKGMKR